MFISIPNGGLYERTSSGFIFARIISRNEEKLNQPDYEIFFNSVEKYLPDLHFCLDSEEGDNLEILEMITHFFNEVQSKPEDYKALNVSKINEEIRLLESEKYGNFLLVNDNGFTQFRCDSFISLTDFYDQLESYKLWKEKK